MTTTSKLIFLFIFILHVAATPTCAQTSCPETRCPGSDIPIRFPFGHKDGGDKRCRYNPTFELSCKGQNQVTITLPSGEYTVNTIDYGDGELWVNDPASCLSRRLLATNFTVDPPFEFPYLISPDKYTFLNCTPNVTTLPYVRDMVVPVACLSGDNYTVGAVLSDSYTLVKEALKEARAPCSVVSEALVPGRAFRDPVFEGGGVFLKWDLQACLLCELKGEACGFLGDTGNDIGCSAPNKPEPPKGNNRWVILVVVGTLVVIFSIGFMICCAWKAGPQLTEQHSISLGINHNNTITTDNNGLDRSIIESYPTTVLLELRDSDNNTCSICLSEYKLGDTIRTIPDCQHYFHVDCIDDWLRKSQACPLCRNILNADGSSSVNPASLPSMAQP